MTKRTLQRKSALDTRSEADMKFFPEQSQEEPQGSNEVKLTEIYVNPQQFRYRLDPETVKELKTSISANGFQGAIVVRPLPESKRSKAGEGKAYELVAGHHRFQAVTELGRETIPADIKELDDRQARRVQFDENYVRKDFNVLEEHEALLQIISDETGIGEKQLRSDVDAAKKAKKDLVHGAVDRIKNAEDVLARYDKREGRRKRTLRGFLETLGRLRNLPEDVKKHLKDIGYAILLEIGPVQDAAIRKQLLDWVLKENPSQEEVRKRRKELSPKSANDNALTTDVETGMKDALKRYRKLEGSLPPRKKKKAEKLVAQLLALLEAQG